MAEPWREHIDLALDEASSTGKEAIAALNFMWAIPQARARIVDAHALHGRKITISKGELNQFFPTEAKITIGQDMIMQTMLARKGKEKQAQKHPNLAEQVLHARQAGDLPYAEGLNRILNSLYVNNTMLTTLMHEFKHAADADTKSYFEKHASIYASVYLYRFGQLMELPPGDQAGDFFKRQLTAGTIDAYHHRTLTNQQAEEQLTQALQQADAPVCYSHYYHLEPAGILDEESKQRLFEQPVIDADNRLYEQMNRFLDDTAKLVPRGQYDIHSIDPTPAHPNYRLTIKQMEEATRRAERHFGSSPEAGAGSHLSLPRITPHNGRSPH